MNQLDLSRTKHHIHQGRKMGLFNLLNSKIEKKVNTPGALAEKIALQYLLTKNLTKVTTNYYCRYGEIDIIMQDKAELVFIEVLYRKNTSHGLAIETIDWRKLKKIKSTINHYMMTNNLGYIPCRIDVIGLQGSLRNPEINWIRNAASD
jgi:putative endonuclease